MSMQVDVAAQRSPQDGVAREDLDLNAMIGVWHKSLAIPHTKKCMLLQTDDNVCHVGECWGFH